MILIHSVIVASGRNTLSIRIFTRANLASVERSHLGGGGWMTIAGVVTEIPVPVTVIVTDCFTTSSPKYPVATPDALVVIGRVEAPVVPDPVAKKPLPELLSVSDTPLVSTSFPYWSTSCTLTVAFVVALWAGAPGLTVI